jgi:hypothetical protein
MTESAFPISTVADQVPPWVRKSLYPQAICDLHGAGGDTGFAPRT